MGKAIELRVDVEKCQRCQWWKHWGPSGLIITPFSYCIPQTCREKMEVWSQSQHEFHETCHSLTFYFMKKDSKRCCDTTMPESIHTKDESKLQFSACFRLWCELTTTINVTEWQVSWILCTAFQVPIVYWKKYNVLTAKVKCSWTCSLYIYKYRHLFICEYTPSASHIYPAEHLYWLTLNHVYISYAIWYAWRGIISVSQCLGWF